MYRLNRERGPWLTECDSDRNAKGGGKRPLVVVVEPRGVRLRPKGCRAGEVFVTWSTIHLRGMAANAAFDTAPTGKGAGKRKATIDLVRKLHAALALAQTVIADNDGRVRHEVDVALLAAQRSGLVVFGKDQLALKGAK